MKRISNIMVIAVLLMSFLVIDIPAKAEEGTVSCEILKEEFLSRSNKPLDNLTYIDDEIIMELSDEYEIMTEELHNGDKVFYFNDMQSIGDGIYSTRAVYTASMEDGNADVVLWVEMEYEDKIKLEGSQSYTGYKPTKVRGKLVSRSERYVKDLILTCGGMGDTLENAFQRVIKTAKIAEPSVGTIYYFVPQIPYYFMIDSNAAINYAVSVAISHTGSDYYTYEARNYVGGISPW